MDERRRWPQRPPRWARVVGIVATAIGAGAPYLVLGDRLHPASVVSAVVFGFLVVGAIGEQPQDSVDR